MSPADNAMVAAFRTQIGWCQHNHAAPFTADVLAAILRDFEAGGDWRRLLADWPADPITDAAALRAVGAAHRLALKGIEPFKSVYERLDRDPDVLDDVARKAAAWPQMPQWLKNPPQTNEVMRSAVLLGGFLEIARTFDLPLRLREIGCSGGLNLIWDRYRYRLGGLDWGTEDSPVRLEPKWRGPTPPPAEIRIASRKGVDQLPIDLADGEQRNRLLSYVWADQADRVTRVRQALALALQDPPTVEEGDAADWAEAELADLPEGQTTVLYHSIVWPYLPKAKQERIQAALEAAGANAHAHRGLAHLAFDSQDHPEQPALTLTLWPGGQRRVLAEAHPHGRWINWNE
jgi:hypothetical protein